MDDAAQTIIERDQPYSKHGGFKEQGDFADKLLELLTTAPGWKHLRGYQRHALTMDAMKTSRILHGNPDYQDHWHDKAGYALLVEGYILKGSPE